MKRFEIEIWIDGFDKHLIYQTDESCFEDAYEAAIKTITAHRKYERKCRIISIQEINN